MHNNQTYYKYPSLRVTRFVGREGLLQEIDDIFHDLTNSVNPKIVVLLGMGGSGKTQIALKYCQRAEATGMFTGVFWIDASDPNTVTQSFITIAEGLSLTKQDLADADASVQLVVSTIGAWTTPWLIIFDNYDQPAAFKDKIISEYFPRESCGAILFTSRHAAATRLGHKIIVTSMPEDEGLDLLLLRAGQNKSEENIREGEKIAQRLGYLALAIDQAGAYLSSRSLELHLFMDEYNNRQQKILEETPDIWEYRKKLNSAEAETSLSVFTTWEMSFDQIGTGGHNKREREHLLTLSAFFDNRDICEGFFRTHFELKHPEWMQIFIAESDWDKYEFRDILADLLNLSLVQSVVTDTAGTRFSLHPLIQDWVKLRIDPHVRVEYTIEAISILADFIDAQDKVGSAFQSKQRIISHMDAAIHNSAQFLGCENELGTWSLVDPAISFAFFYQVWGRYQEAEELYGQVLKERKRQLGLDHPNTLGTMHNLAGIYRYQGRYQEAEELYGQVLKKQKRQPGPDHPDTLGTMHNLAVIYEVQGRYQEAEELYGQVLKEQKRQLGPDHLDILGTMHNLAGIYGHQGQYQKAEEVCEQVLKERKMQLGLDHSDTLGTMHNLAGIYRYQGRYQKAEKLYEQVLNKQNQRLGPDHPDMLRTIHNLAVIYEVQGRYREAEELYGQVLKEQKRQLRPAHPDTLKTMHSLAGIYRHQGRYQEAEELFKEVLKEQNRQLGPDHPDTVRAMHSLAGIYGHQGQYQNAEELYKQVLKEQKRQLRPDHLDTLRTIHNLTSIYQHQGRYQKAEMLCEQVLKERKRQLGPDHPDTLGTIHNLTSIYRHQGRYQEAEELCKQVLKEQKRQLGPDHPDTLGTIRNLTSIYRHQGRYQEAEELCEQVLKERKRQLGPDHPDTLRTMYNLAGIYQHQGRYQEAEELREQVLKERKRQLAPDHSDALRTMHNLTGIYRHQGRYREAEELAAGVGSLRHTEDNA
jgi:tetratricopeptide (TPR) repeat protein